MLVHKVGEARPREPLAILPVLTVPDDRAAPEDDPSDLLAVGVDFEVYRAAGLSEVEDPHVCHHLVLDPVALIRHIESPFYEVTDKNSSARIILNIKDA